MGKKREAEEPEVARSSSSSFNALAKRARYSSESAEQAAHVVFRHAERILRPGLPAAIRLDEYRFVDRHSPPYRDDNKEGHYVYAVGENISSRYKILGKFGEGTFGRVLECWDRHDKEYVAVKIVRNVEKYRHAAMIELEVLNTLEHNDPEGKRNCVKLKDWFDYRNHVCLVFEKLGPSLFDFLRRNNYQPFPLAFVQAVGRQLLEAVAYMHELSLVHTDLKPENILLLDDANVAIAPVAPGAAAAGGGSGGGAAAAVAGPGEGPARIMPARAVVRVIDFGSATFNDAYHSSVVSTRHYRAPEVILGLGWSFPCDLWSMGCILVELASGDALFQTHENLEHLAMMERVLGPLPVGMAAASDKGVARLFTTEGRLDWPRQASSSRSVRAVSKLCNLRELLSSRVDVSDAHAVDLLVDLVQGLLRYEPSKRVSAADALRHGFFQVQLTMPAGEPSPEPEALPLPLPTPSAALTADPLAAGLCEVTQGFDASSRPPVTVRPLPPPAVGPPRMMAPMGLTGITQFVGSSAALQGLQQQQQQQQQEWHPLQLQQQAAAGVQALAAHAAAAASAMDAMEAKLIAEEAMAAHAAMAAAGGCRIDADAALQLQQQQQQQQPPQELQARMQQQLLIQQQQQQQQQVAAGGPGPPGVCTLPGDLLLQAGLPQEGGATAHAMLET